MRTHTQAHKRTRADAAALSSTSRLGWASQSAIILWKETPTSTQHLQVSQETGG